VFDVPGGTTFGFKEGVITGGSMSSSSYTLTGQETTDDLCLTGASSTNPISITITGQCGTDVTIKFSSAAFQKGTFIGNINCFT
jgi:hypothetical protein